LNLILVVITTNVIVKPNMQVIALI